MKHLSLFLKLFALIVIVAAGSCTRNNGDIGDWFGLWRVDNITIDGEPDPDYTSPAMIWKFHGSVIQILIPDFDNHDTTTSSGSWHQEGDRLFIDFEWDLGTPPEISHLPDKAMLDIIRLSGNTIELRYVADDNTVYFYKLKKWG